jgi:drug/metabolite transporter (DMT)-like permease
VALYVIIALIGTLLPNSASYTAAIHLPSGILSIVLSLVPMLSFPIALALGMDRFSALRLLGLCLGLAAILLIALPETSLPDRSHGLVAAGGPGRAAFYAVEGNFVARFGTAGLDPVQVLLGASIVGAVMALPLALMTGSGSRPCRPGARRTCDRGLLRGPCAGLFGYVWMVGRAGAVFAAQVSYLVTAFGIFWAWVILGETYSGWVWAAVALMFAGLFLVQPRPRRAKCGDLSQPAACAARKTSLAGGHPVGDDARRGRVIDPERSQGTWMVDLNLSQTGEGMLALGARGVHVRAVPDRTLADGGRRHRHRRPDAGPGPSAL